MKLTTEQVDAVFDYVASHDIKWYELQIELTDHMVTSMEEFWEKDPELTFHQVKQYTEVKFGRNGFKEIEEERKRILQKEYRKVQWKMITEYLKFPKIFGSILLVYLAYTFSAYFVSPQKYLAVLFCSLLIICLPSLYYWWKSKEIEGKHFLTLETLNPTLLVFSFFPSLGMSSTTQLKEELLQHQWLVLFFCCIWVLVILFSITAIHLQKKTIENVKRQYQLS